MPFDPNTAQLDKGQFDAGTAKEIGRPGLLKGARDLGIDALGGAVSATGYLVRGAGELADRTGVLEPIGAPLRGIGDLISGGGEKVSKMTSPEYQQAKADTQITGDITKPSTWSFGKDPNFFGIAGNAANTIGQVAPMVASAVVTKGKMLPSAAVGAAVTAGAQGQQEEQRVLQMDQAGIDQLPGYQKLIAAGVDPEQARKQLARATGNEAAITAAPLGALDAFTEGLPFLSAGRHALANIATSRLGRAATAAGIGAIGEGAQEVAENAATIVGANRVTGENRSVTEDSFGNFVGGALAGGPVGAIGGAISPDRTAGITAPRDASEVLDMLATDRIPDTRIDDLVMPGAAQNQTTEPVDESAITPPAPAQDVAESAAEPASAPVPAAPPAAAQPAVDPGERVTPGPLAGAVPPVQNTPEYEEHAVRTVGFVPDPARGPLSRAVDTGLKTGVIGSDIIAIPGQGQPSSQPLIVPGQQQATAQQPIAVTNPQSLRNRTVYDAPRRAAEEQAQIAEAEARAKPRTRVQQEPQYEERLSKLNTPFKSEVGAKAAARAPANAGFDVFKRAPSEWVLRRVIPGTDPNALPPSAARFNTKFSNAAADQVSQVDPNTLAFREESQNRTGDVREMFPKGSDYTPVVAIRGEDGSRQILDGHNRAVVAKERGDQLPVVDISREQYEKLSSQGFDDTEIAYAALTQAGQDGAASSLDQQFPGAGVAKRGMQAWQEMPDTRMSNRGAERGDWRAFAPESETLGVPRAEMPQIKSENRGALVNYLAGKGVKSEQAEVPASSLKPTQAEFSMDKVRKAADNNTDRSILVSSDGHVLDGHHQWLAKLQARGNVKVIRLDAPIKQLLEDVKGFPSARKENGARFSVRAWHGSPHDFDEFKTANIGTGEGAQAFGHGLYFAGNRAVAEHYRKGLSYKDVVREFRRDAPDDADFNEVMDAVGRGEFKPKMAEVLRALQADDWLGFDYPAQAITAAFRNLENNDPSQRLRDAVKNYGALYEVELAPKETDYLDWDAPMSEQQKHVRDAIGDNLRPDMPAGLLRDFEAGNITGGEFYNRFADSLNEMMNYPQESEETSPTKEVASEILAEAGIPGIKYLDGSSRRAGSGHHNYVIFDDKNVKVVARFSERKSGPQTGNGLRADVVRRIVDPITRNWNVKVNVVDTPLQFPADVTQHERFDPELSEAVIHNGEIYIAANMVDTVRDAYRLIAHEGIAHAGVEGMVGKQAWGGVVKDVNAMLDRNVDGWLTTEVAKRYPNADADTRAAEAVALMAERGVRSSLMTRLIAAARKSLRALGIKVDFSESDLREMIAAAARQMNSGKPQAEVRMSNAKDVTTLSEFKRWFGDSKVVDENGEPLVVYHGAGRDITQFAAGDDSAGQTNGNRTGAWGSYFTSRPKEASIYAEMAGAESAQQVIPVYLSIQNPYVMNRAEWGQHSQRTAKAKTSAEGRADARAVRAKIESDGHDGIVIRDSGFNDEWVAFRPEQIKSATGNTGAFDPKNPDIRFSNAVSADGIEVEELDPASLDFSMFAGLSARERGSPAMQAEAATLWRALGTDSPYFKRWFGLSRVKKADGTPIPMYHGTARAFDQFELKRAGESTGFAASGLGIFMTPKRAAAERYADGGNVLKLYARMEKPYVMPLSEFSSFESVDQAQQRRAELMAKGYDGIFVKEDGTTIVFEPSQVKSADNVGTFSLSDDRFRYSSRAVARDELSTRVPTAKKAGENALEKLLVIGLDSMKADPKAFAKNVELVTTYPNYRPAAGADTIDKQAERFIEHAARNLLWLHDEMDPQLRQRAQLWYDGARKIAERWATRYGISEAEAAGVMAVLSPQKDWFMNVSLAERVLDVMTEQRDTAWSPEMAATAQRIFGKDQYKPLLAEIRGKRLSELTDPTTKAMWVRIYDEAYNPRSHQIISPEGDFAGVRKTGAGKDYSVAWGSLGEIGKAVSIIDDPSLANISAMMGEQHKVRNFYNNIVNPNSDAGHVTIDTHAVAAALLRPLAGASTEVTHNFGGTGSASSSISGSSGTYGLYAEAYRRAAKRRNILPRQMQSITWEAVRGLFSPTFKSNASNVEAIDEIWNNYRKGRVSLETARNETAERAGGITEPDWARSAARDDEATPASSYKAEVPRTGVSGRSAESAAGRGRGGVAERPEVTRFSIASAVRERVSDAMYTTRTFNSWWHRAVGTQYHKAQVDDDFRPVYEKGQDFLNDISRIAMEASDEAPTLLPRLDGLRDILKAGPSRADITRVSDAVFTGTLVDEQVYSDAELRSRFGLNDKQIGLYREFRAAVDRSLDELNAADIAQLVRTDAPGAIPAIRATPADAARIATQALQALQAQYPARASDFDATITEIADRQNKIDELKIKGYAPLMRFGKYTVYVTDQGQQIYFGTFEREYDATRMAREMRADYPNATVQQGVMSQDSFKMFKGMSLDTLELFANTTGMSSGRAAQDFIRLAKNNRSAMKRLLRRKGVAGFESDSARVLAAFITSNARAASSAYNLADLSRAVEDVPREKGDVKDEAVRLAMYLQNPGEEAAGLRGLLFTQFIGGSVASAALNMTQPVMMTFPWLSQFVGAGRAAKALAAAGGIAVGKAPSDPNLVRAMARATKEGVIAPHEIHNLYAESIRNFGSSLASRRALKAWGSLFALAEGFNRRMTFAAAYSAAQQLGQPAISARGFNDAYDFAVNAVEATQGVYNRGNRPNWARGAIGATLFTFKQYSVSYLEFLKRLPAKERALALGILVLASGLQGLPGADDLEDIIDTVGQSLGWNTNSKRALREAAAAALGEDVGGLLTHGLSSATPIDVQQRLGLGNLIPGTAILKKSTDDKSREVMEALGPAGGLAQQLANAYDRASSGDYFGAAKAVAPLAVKNLAKGVESAVTGEYRDEKGRKVINVSAGDAVAKAIGFQPANVARTQRVIGEAQQDVNTVRAIEADIADQWAKSAAAGDRPGILKALQQLRSWNAANPETPIRIDANQIRRRVLQLRMSKDQRFLKSAPKELRARLARRLQEAQDQEEDAVAED